MKSIKYLFLLIFLVFITNAQTQWQVDNYHSNVGFSVTHLLISEVEGDFSSFSADITTKSENFTDANIEFSIDVNSINTGIEARDKHLKSDDFFNAEKFPKMKFVSKSMKKVGDKEYKLVGDFTIRGKTHELVLDVIYNGTVKGMQGKTRAGFKITGELNRFDYGLKWNKLMEAGGAVVGKEVRLNINLQLIKQ